MLGAIALVLARDGKSSRSRSLRRGRRLVPRPVRARARPRRSGSSGDVGSARAPSASSYLGRPRARAVGRAALGDRRPRRDRVDDGAAADPARPPRAPRAASGSQSMRSRAIVLALWLLAFASERTSILVRMPGALKRALVREVARRELEPERRRRRAPRGALRRRLRSRAAAAGRRSRAPAGAVLLRMPPELRRRAQGAARRRKPRQRPGRSARSRTRSTIPHDSQRKGHHGTRPTARRTAGALQGQGPRRADRRRQLRQLARSRASSTTRTRPTTSSSRA